MGFLFPALLLSVFFGIWYFGTRYQRKVAQQRVDALRQSAEEMGLTFSPLTDSAESLTANRIADGFSQFRLMNVGRGKSFRNVITGDSGEVGIYIFDYRYTTGSGKNRRVHRNTVAALVSPRLLACPAFRIRRQSFFDSVGSLLGFQDINFDAHPQFSKQFVLQGVGEEQIRQFFQPPLIQFFESRPSINVECAGDQMLFYHGGLTPPAAIRDLLAEAYEVFGHMVDGPSATASDLQPPE